MQYESPERQRASISTPTPGSLPAQTLDPAELQRRRAMAPVIRRGAILAAVLIAFAFGILPSRFRHSPHRPTIHINTDNNDEGAQARVEILPFQDHTGRETLADGSRRIGNALKSSVRDEESLRIVGSASDERRISRGTDGRIMSDAEELARALAAGHISSADFVVTGMYTLKGDSLITGVRI